MYFTTLSAKIQIPTPLIDLGSVNGVKIFVKRDDLTHPEISGNKWRKLKQNLVYHLSNHFKGIISFGGAFSNHIYSLSAACAILNIPLVVIIRGEEVNENNSTLKFLADRGQKIIKVSRQEYRKKLDSDIIREILHAFSDYYLIPEGGTNELAISGMREVIDEINEQLPQYDYLACSAGTFGTSAGFLAALSVEIGLVVYPAVKGSWVHDQINLLLKLDTKPENLYIRNQYHFGGYGKGIDSTKKIAKEFLELYDLPLDPIYMAKAFFGLMEDIKAGFYKKGSTVVFYHSGGLQGIDVQK